MELNIVDLIETNPITKLSPTCNGKLLDKVRTSFSEYEQQLFVTSFYCFLNYDSKIEFVIDLDDVWKWIGFSQKQKVKALLERIFVKDIDYKILLYLEVEQEKKHGGHNKEKIMLTINAFNRYAGISHDDQYSDQPVIKICCSTGEQTNFANMADAAKDANISAPGIRNRILTKVHIDDFHWIFNKTATHYR